MADVIRVDQSGLGVWRNRCQLQHYWGYHHQLEPKGRIMYDSPFHHGSLDHEALEVTYHPDTWMNQAEGHKALKKLWEKLKSKDPKADTEPDHIMGWAGLLLEADECLKSYYDHYADIDSTSMEPVGTEIPFRLKLHEQVEFYGKIDAVIRWKKGAPLPNTDRRGDGRLWFPEYKFHKTPSEHPAYIEWSHQLSDYCLVGRALYSKDEFGGMLNRITRKAQSKTLQNFFCHVVERSTTELQFTAKNIVVQALQMKFAYDHPLGIHFLVPRLDDYPYDWQNECVGCVFNHDVCKAFRKGNDFEILQLNNYQKRDSYAFSEQDALKVPVTEVDLAA